MKMRTNDLKKYAKVVKREKELDRVIIAKVVGVTFDDRQEVLQEVCDTTKVKLQRDRRNQYDPYAVEVLVSLDHHWLQAGYLSSHMSKKISKVLDSGQKLDVKVHKKLGGCYSEHTDEFLNHGLEVSISPK